MENILYVAEVANIAEVHIKTIHQRKGHQRSYQRQKNIHFKECVEGILYTNIDEPSMITNTNNVSVNYYSYLSNVKQNSAFLLILMLKEREKFENCSNIFTR